MADPYHAAWVEQGPDGNLGRCECGDRDTAYRGYGDALEWCDGHEADARARRLNAGSKPGLKALLLQYREKADSLVYTPEERAQWAVLADEIEQRLKPKGQVMSQQDPLFEMNTDQTAAPRRSTR